ncbi:MAG: hypothetical protein IJP07_06850, partial [Firmicutes bacterium]|nr:hypothetical protein [Bacillota bacterium]
MDRASQFRAAGQNEVFSRFPKVRRAPCAPNFLKRGRIYLLYPLALPPKIATLLSLACLPRNDSDPVFCHREEAFAAKIHSIFQQNDVTILQDSCFAGTCGIPASQEPVGFLLRKNLWDSCFA